MKASEIRQKDIKELEALLFDLREKLRQLKFQLFSGRIKNLKEIRKTKKVVARILTVLREKQLMAKNKKQ
jgi:large subunit ribosomal protein L29